MHGVLIIFVKSSILLRQHGSVYTPQIKMPDCSPHSHVSCKWGEIQSSFRYRNIFNLLEQYFFLLLLFYNHIAILSDFLH